jgi:Leucine-rich repeat (LRR) protein
LFIACGYSNDFALTFCRQFNGSSKWFNFTVSDPKKHKLKFDLSEESIEEHLNMTILHIDFQPFNHIFAGIGETFPNSQYLDLGKQQIKFVDRANFEHLEKLERLNLTRYKIEHLPEKVFWDLKNLKQLDISQNKIAKLSDKIFIYLYNIEDIDLKNNTINDFPSSLLVNNLKMKTFNAKGNLGNTSNINITKIPSVKISHD